MMGSSSINTSTLLHPISSNRCTRQRQFPCSIVKPFPIFQTHINKTLNFPQIQAHNPKFHNPNSIFATYFSPQKEISNFLSEKIVLLLFGSFIFMGMGVVGPTTRPVLAQPVQEISESENTEQERETQEGKNEDEEEKMYVKLLEGSPRNVDALKGVFYGKMKRGKSKEAIEYVERLIDVEPGEVEWRLLQALCYEMVGQLSKAKRLFKDILKRRPLLIRALHTLGKACDETRVHDIEEIVEDAKRGDVPKQEMLRRSKRDKVPNPKYA